MAMPSQQVETAVTQYQTADDFPYGILTEEDMFDDATGAVPTKGLGTPLSLKDRTLRRLSKMLGAEATVQNVPTENGIHILLSRSQDSVRSSVLLDEQLRKHVRELEVSLKSIAQGPGQLCNDACEDLWEIILVSNYGKADLVIQALQKLFKHNQGTFDHLVTRMFGIDDIDSKGSKLDRELGDHIIIMAQHVNGFDGSMKEWNTLIRFAATMTKTLSNLRDRMKYIVEKSAFADKLFGLICQLGFPERVYATLVRSARASQKFRNVTFHLGPPSPAKTVSFASPLVTATPRSTIVRSSPSKEKSKQVLRYEATADATATTAPAFLSFLPPPPSAVQRYLPRKDRNLALSRLEPAEKQMTAQLADTVLKGNLLSTQTAVWYNFGFVTAKDEDQERQLAGLYAKLLKEADDPEATFCELQTALKTNSIVSVFDKYNYAQFRELFPCLDTFLTTPPHKRSTVWRLRQFILDPSDDEPPPCLQRDYGFKYCRQREEVLRLKEIHTNALEKMGPKSLHESCVNGRLYENAVREGVVVAGKDKRFLANDYPSPFVGLDSPRGLEPYLGRFYKQSLKL
ncbi:uncharacterized protein J4E79_009335 [Alternaria viburni]|uniref:uncharacterized protein n=1 Tax=Alternaria viburni TaxID=566460 RepID=UPI0020C4F376|nr:uncharacterized protein J4E79_009335 [Alternaria viburni]KAI4651136.1 hypothetical protein J4E79_009335 [Alternaria viburni]